MNDDVIPLNKIGKIGTVKVYNQSYVNKQQKRIAELEKELEQAKKVQVVEHFEAYGQCRDSRRIASLEKELKSEKEYSATLQKEIDEYTNSHTLCAKYKELKKNCDETQELLDKQIEATYKLDKENVELKETIHKAEEIIRGLYFIIQGRIDYENNIAITDEMWRAEQFWKK